MMHGGRGTRRRARLGTDLTILGIVGLLLIAAIGTGGVSLYQQFYSPSAFVQRYLDLLASGRAADALQLPGVSVDLALLEGSDIDRTASEALLRTAALAPLTDAHITSEKRADDAYTVKAAYTARGVRGATTFQVVQDGWSGISPNWRFANSPLAEIELTVRGADQFAVNGFAIDRRQVSSAGVDAAPLDPLHLLVLTPGLYSVTVDTAIASSPGVSVLADTPLARTPIDVRAQATERFVEVVQQRVEEFLTACTTQDVLKPTACPFGLEVQDRIVDAPKWSIAQQPTVAVVPDGANWAIPATDAVAHIEVEVQSLYDGSIKRVEEDVPFQVNGTIAILPDGSASIRVGSPEE